MNAPISFGLRPEARTAWETLAAALAGISPACTVDADPWTSEDHADRQEAAEACQPCPARSACAAFGEANREPFGVWGGTDRTPLRGRPPKTRQGEPNAA